VDPIACIAIANGIVTNWLQQTSQYTPPRYYTGATPVAGGNAYDGVWTYWVWYMIPRFNFFGMEPSLGS
jgi:hypothetical protein